MYQLLSSLTVEYDWRLAALSGVACTLALLVAVMLLQRTRAARAARFVLDRQERIAEAERKLEAQSTLIDTALSNMTQGLAMFDRDLRVVLCNASFLRMYDLPPEVATSRCTISELIALHYERNGFPGSLEDYLSGILEEYAAGQHVRKTVTLADGRVISITNSPVAGGGRISTHEDITERHRLHEANVEAEKQLRAQKQQTDAALAHMSHGFCLFDAEARIVRLNHQFLDMFGMSPDVVKPGTTFLEMMLHRKTLNALIEDAEELAGQVLASAARRETRDHLMRLADGRQVRAFHRPMPDGGWVTTYEDITERIEVQERLQEQKLHLDTALDNMSQGIVMFDAGERLAVCNRRYLEIYGIAQEDVTLGMTLEALLSLRHRKGMLPRDPVSHAGKIKSATRQGRSLRLISALDDGRFISVDNVPMAGGGWVSTHEDITTRRNAEDQLKEQKLQLDTALDNMTQGLIMFDAQRRLVLCNQRYVQMYHLPPEAVRPGIPLRDLLQLRRAHNTFGREPDPYIEELSTKLAAGQAVDLITEMPDGRIISVGNQPMPGGGWVSAHTDITEQRRAEEQLRQQKLHLDTALNNMSQGLNLFDADGRLVVCNERYRQMYRLPPEAVRLGASMEQLIKARLAAGTFFALDPAEYIVTLRSRLSKREPSTVTMELTDGRTISMQSQPTPDDAGWVVTHEDITERRRIEKERDRSTALATSVIENVPATIIVKDARTLRYLLINRAGERYYNVAREHMIGKVAQDIFPTPTSRMIVEHDAEVLASKLPRRFDEHPSQTPSGEQRIVVTTRVPILGSDGEPQYLLSVIEDRTNRKRAEARIAHLAHHDMLTGLPNRAAFNACLESTIETAAREGTSFVLMSLDVARLKEVNDVYGYGTGDRLLTELSQRLQACVGGAFVARLGGDEFSIIATDGEQPQAAEQLAERVQTTLSEEFVIDGKHVQSGASIGIAMFPQNGEDAATLTANADAALHRAKIEDRGHHRFFEAEMDKRLRDRRVLQQDLGLAIEGGQLSLHYQPQARTDGHVFGFEALVRWRHPVRGNISPGTFIPLAEESGLIIPVGEWILREACRQAASWPRPLGVAVNLSPVQFRHGDVAALVQSVLQETGLAPQRLELEITEGVLIGDFSRALSVLRRLKAMGVRIAMDDFGTGYSSLSYLQAFPFDKIKIDQAFISNLETNAQSATIVRAVIGLARGFAVPVIAEGVETQAQLNFLSGEGCDEVQGYLIGRPQPIEDYASLVGRPIRLKRRDQGLGAA